MTTTNSTPDQGQQQPTRKRDGFALPTAILVISLVTIGLVASFSATGSEIAIVRSRTYALRWREGTVPAEWMKKLSVDVET